MSARSKRAQQTSETTTTTTRRTTSVTVPSTASSGDRRRQRSVSPLNISRNEEKEELAELNDRLASYIDYVRKLEMDKEHLKRKIKTYSEERLVRTLIILTNFKHEVKPTNHWVTGKSLRFT